jgi:hypothetical protein
MPLSHWYAKDDTAISPAPALSAFSLLLMATISSLLGLAQYPIGLLRPLDKSRRVSILLSHWWVSILKEASGPVVQPAHNQLQITLIAFIGHLPFSAVYQGLTLGS